LSTRAYSHAKVQKSLTIFTNDEDKAVDIAMAISNYSMINAILVADECGVDKRLKLNELLNGNKDRARVIAIDNSGERPASYSPELWLEKMPPDICGRNIDQELSKCTRWPKKSLRIFVWRVR